MKKIMIALALVFMLTTQSFAFVYEMKILTQEELSDLKDDALVEYYVDVMVEKKASEAFHENSGFSPKEYGNYKRLLKFVIELRKEIAKRGLDAPPVVEWLE